MADRETSDVSALKLRQISNRLRAAYDNFRRLLFIIGQGLGPEGRQGLGRTAVLHQTMSLKRILCASLLVQCRSPGV